jgi:hypothetical protein
MIPVESKEMFKGLTFSFKLDSYTEHGSDVLHLCVVACKA